MANKDFPKTSPIGQRIHRIAEMAAEADKLKRQIDEEKAYLLGYAIRNTLDGVSSCGISLSRRMKVTWSFTEAVTTLAARLKKMQDKEKATGAATKVESEHLVMNVRISAIAQSKEVQNA